MRKFIKKSFSFLIVIFITSFLFQQLVFLLVKTINVGELGVMNKIVEGKINSDILICGSSRSLVGIDPLTISQATGFKAFNLSLNGSRLGIQLPVLKTYLKYNKKPKILIQELGFESLRLDEKIFAPYKYLPYIYDDELYQGLKKIDPNFWMHKYIPLTNLIYFNADFQKVFFKDFFASLSDGNDYLKEGYNPHNNSWTIDAKSFIKLNLDDYFSLTDKGNEYLKEVIEICLELNIKIILVTTPVYAKFNQSDYNKEKMIKTFTAIAYKNNIPYYNYLDIPISEEKKYFYNFTHLADNGAKEFSKIISKELNKKHLYSVSYDENLK